MIKLWILLFYLESEIICFLKLGHSTLSLESFSIVPPSIVFKCDLMALDLTVTLHLFSSHWRKKNVNEEWTKTKSNVKFLLGHAFPFVFLIFYAEFYYFFFLLCHHTMHLYATIIYTTISCESLLLTHFLCKFYFVFWVVLLLLLKSLLAGIIWFLLRKINNNQFYLSLPVYWRQHHSF